jgi:HD domain
MHFPIATLTFYPRGPEAHRIKLIVEDDGDLLISAAILHDIGYAPAIATSNFHPLDGARNLVQLRAPSRLCGLVANHSNARREARIRQLDGLLSDFEDEATAA